MMHALHASEHMERHREWLRDELDGLTAALEAMNRPDAPTLRRHAELMRALEDEDAFRESVRDSLEWRVETMRGVLERGDLPPSTAAEYRVYVDGLETALEEMSDE